DGVGVLDGELRPGLGQLNRLFALLFRAHENVGGFLAVGFGQHDCVPLIVPMVVSCAAAIIDRRRLINAPPRRRSACSPDQRAGSGPAGTYSAMLTAPHLRNRNRSVWTRGRCWSLRPCRDEP